MAYQKQKNQINPFENLILDDYEKEIETSIARGEWQPVENSEEMKKMFQEAAKRYTQLQQSQKITLRINQGDLIRLKAKANKKNIPYQTLLNALIRDYVTGVYSIKL